MSGKTSVYSLNDFSDTLASKYTSLITSSCEKLSSCTFFSFNLPFICYCVVTFFLSSFINSTNDMLLEDKFHALHKFIMSCLVPA